MVNINVINDIIKKSYLCRKEIHKYKIIIMTQLTNKYYYEIIESIKISSNNGNSYCVLNFDEKYFSKILTTYSNSKSKYENNLEKKSISEIGLGSPQTIAYKWLKWLTNINNKYLKVNDKNVPCLGNPICYKVIPRNSCLIKCEHWGPIYKRCDNTLRNSILIEFRWGEIPENNKKDFHPAQDINYNYNNNYNNYKKKKWNTNCKYDNDNRFKKEVSVKDVEYLFKNTDPFTNDPFTNNKTNNYE